MRVGKQAGRPAGEVPVAKPRSLSSDLPRGLVWQRGCKNLYVRVPAPGGGPSARMATGIPYDGLNDEEREGALRIGGKLVALLDDLAVDAEYHVVLEAIRRRTITMNEVIGIGFRNGRYALLAMAKANEAASHDVDLLPLLARFGAYQECLHPGKGKEGRAVLGSTRDQQVSHVRRYLDWAMSEAATDTAVAVARPLSLLNGALFATYLEHLQHRTQRDAASAGITDTTHVGRRAKRDCYGALAQFCRFLSKVVQLDGVRDVTEGLPRPVADNNVRTRFLTRLEVTMLIDALFEVGGAWAAAYCGILHGSALDTTDVARMTASQFSRGGPSWRVDSSSRKAKRRQRRVQLYSWVHRYIAPFLDERIREDGPNARLFPSIADRKNSRDAYARVQREAIELLVARGHEVFAGYEPRDSRHSVAIDMALRGAFVQEIAQQLGNTEAMVFAVYARWLKKEDKSERLERLMSDPAPTEMALPTEAPAQTQDDHAPKRRSVPPRSHVPPAFGAGRGMLPSSRARSGPPADRAETRERGRTLASHAPSQRADDAKHAAAHHRPVPPRSRSASMPQS